MCKHVLVIEPRKEIIEDLEDRLESIGHTCDVVRSQRQAREMLDLRNDYSYIILSQEIPVRPERPSKMKFGYNLFIEIQEVFNGSMPVIVTVDRRYLNSNTAVKMAHQGAYIAVKPFEDNGELSLEDVIDKALESRVVYNPVNNYEKDFGESQIMVEPENSKKDDYIPDDDFIDDVESECEIKENRTPVPEMVFFKNRVELCGVTVCGDSSTLTRRLLDLLKERAPEGKYRAYSGYELAVITDYESGQPGISACINNFKRKISKMVKQNRIPMIPNADQIIINDRSHGYRLEESIIVIENTLANKSKSAELTSQPNASDSQQKILDYLVGNRKASRSELQQKLNLSEYAVNRHLQSLRDRGLVRCAGKGKSTLWLPMNDH